MLPERDAGGFEQEVIFWYNVLMTSQKDDGTAATDDTPMVPPGIPSAEQLFDGIMVDIDPRFTIAGQKELVETLKTASPDEKKATLAAFEKALAACEEKAKEYYGLLGEVTTAYRACVESIAQASDAKTAEDLLDTTPTP